MWSLILQYQNASVEHQAGNTGVVFDLKRFGVAELAAKDLFQRRPLDTFLPNRIQKSESVPAQRQLDDWGDCHLLIAGFGTCGEQVLLQALNCGVFSLTKRIKITVLDYDGARKEHLLRAKYCALDKICQIHFISMDIRSNELPQALEVCAGEITYAAVCFEDADNGLWAAKLLSGLLPTLAPIMVRMDSNEDIFRFLELPTTISDRVTPFGMRRNLLTRAVLLDATLDATAKEFYAAYMDASRNLNKFSSEGVGWETLKQLKKDSVRAQAIFYPYLTRMRDYRMDSDTYLRLREEFYACSKDATQLDALLRRPECAPLLELAALEHARWCAFLYSHNYCYGAERTETTHPCLVDNWMDLCRVPETKGAMIYDFIPVLLKL